MTPPREWGRTPVDMFWNVAALCWLGLVLGCWVGAILVAWP
jgi:hypothetical protein